jgi:hypothetical protein
MADTDNGAADTGLTAPYTAFQSVKTAARNMKEHGVPGRIDRSVLTNFSGSVASQIMQALKFLGLTNDDGVPTPALLTVVQAADDEQAWAVALAPILKKAYAPMFTLDLNSASPAQFTQHFRKTYAGADNVSRKSLTFFVNALQDAKIPVSTYILKNKKPRSGGTPGKKRVVKAAANVKGEAAISGKGGIVVPVIPATQKSQSEILLGFMDKDMKSLEQDALWTLIKFFKAKGH